MESIRSYERMTVVQLRELAREKKVRLPYGVNKAQIVELLSRTGCPAASTCVQRTDEELEEERQKLLEELKKKENGNVKKE